MQNQAMFPVSAFTAIPPGNLVNITQAPCVASRSSFETVALSKSLEDLIKKSSNKDSPPGNSCSQVHWDNLGQWIPSIIGQTSQVAYHDVRFFDNAVETFWHLIGVNYGSVDTSLVLRVRIHTRIDSDGNLDYTASSDATLNDLRFTLTNTQMDLGKNDEVLDTLWEPSLPLSKYAQYAIQTRPAIPRGRTLIASGNCLIDASGGNPTSLEPVLQKILTYTTIDKPFSLRIPDVSHHIILPPDTVGRENVVKGIGTSFQVSCTVSGKVEAANAQVNDHGLFIDTNTILDDRDQQSSNVNFVFKTRTLGFHDVILEFATTPSMTISSKTIQIEVIAG